MAEEKKPDVKEEAPTLEDLQKQIEALTAENNSLKADAEKVKKTISNANADAASWKEKYRSTLDEAKLNTAAKLGATEKTWHTMGDNKVRDTHAPLDGVSAPINGQFYTWDADSAPAPGQFEKADNNVNCRCWLTFSK